MDLMNKSLEPVVALMSSCKESKLSDAGGAFTSLKTLVVILLNDLVTIFPEYVQKERITFILNDSQKNSPTSQVAYPSHSHGAHILVPCPVHQLIRASLISLHCACVGRASAQVACKIVVLDALATLLKVASFKNQTARKEACTAVAFALKQMVANKALKIVSSPDLKRALVKVLTQSHIQCTAPSA